MTEFRVAFLVILLHQASGQLASFDELTQAYLGSIGSQEPRDDRSLTNTYPFNQVATQETHHHSHQAASQYTGNIGSHTLPASATRLNLQPQSQNPGFSLLSGFGSSASSRNQYQIGAPASSYQASPYQTQTLGGASYQSVPRTATYQSAPGAVSHQSAQVQTLGGASYQSVPRTVSYQSAPGAVSHQSAPVQPPTYRNRAPQPPFTSPSQFLRITTASSACPRTAGLPLSQCGGRVNSCWSVGQTDVDCPNHGLCCFDGCANTCVATPIAPGPGPIPAHRPVPAPIPAHRPVPAPAPIPARALPARNPLQGRQPLGGTSFSDVAKAGKKCIDKIETVEEIEYDEVEECNHSYDRQCHTSYVTEYESQQEEECDDNYKKSCQITYSPSAQNLTVQICRRPLVKDCNTPGPEICRTEYVSECWTRNDPHLVVDDVPKCRTVQDEKCETIQSGYTTEENCKKWPREVCTISRERKQKFNPVTKCEKVPQELCGPSGCGFVEGPEICHDEVKTVVTDIPEEVCDLQPRRTCEHVTKLVPKLSPSEECVDVPKEVCTKGKVNPRTIQKPVTKKWCYTPSQESGLA